MGFDIDHERAQHFTRVQEALEEGLKAIETARSPREVRAARLHAQRRLDELNLQWSATFGAAGEIA